MAITNEKKMELTGNARINEVTVRWTMFQLFFAIHSGALAVILFQFKPETNVIVYVFVSMVGLWFSILWHLATYRAQKLVDYWHQRMAELEEAERDFTQKRIDVFFSEETATKVPTSAGVPIYKVLQRLVEIFIIVWLVLLIVFVVRWIKM